MFLVFMTNTEVLMIKSTYSTTKFLQRLEQIGVLTGNEVKWCTKSD